MGVDFISNGYVFLDMFNDISSVQQGVAIYFCYISRNQSILENYKYFVYCGWVSRYVFWQPNFRKMKLVPSKQFKLSFRSMVWGEEKC